MRNENQDGVTVCDCCRLIPVSHLSLDLPEPIGGWELFLTEQGIDVQPDDCGRPAISRNVFHNMVREQNSLRKLQAETAALRTAEMAEIERRTPVPVGTPAIEGLSALETLAAAPGYLSPSAEFGRSGVNWLADELDRGAAARAEAEAKAKEAAAARMRKDLQ